MSCHGSTGLQFQRIFETAPALFLLLDADPDFATLFRVKVEVDTIIPRLPSGLLALDDWLSSHNVSQVAMESTGENGERRVRDD